MVGQDEVRTTTQRLLATKLNGAPLQKTPFVDVRESKDLLRKKTDPIVPGSPSKAVGITGIRFCVGMYCEPNLEQCFVWHIFGKPMSWGREEDPISGSENHRRIVERFEAWLTGKLGPGTDLVRKTLVLATAQYNLDNWAIIDGVLSWAGVEDKEKWKQTRLRCAGAFIVEEPGREDGVRYFPPVGLMEQRHPGHWSREWEAIEQATMWEDKLGKVEPEKRRGGN